MSELTVTPSSAPYIGRFAPSPTGLLHMGSLLAALASYLDARSHGGHWLLRMEDLDPPREPPEAAPGILAQLAAFGLTWDGDVVYQSRRQDAYLSALSRLEDLGLVYRCNCSRQRMRDLDSVYDGHCLRQPPPADTPCALRLRTDQSEITLQDAIQGRYTQRLGREVGDFVIRRKDGLMAYQLAVVVDDAWQQISHVVRGHDLLESTPRQIYLQRLLGYPTPCYAHIPILLDRAGDKLSKQRFAEAISPTGAGPLLRQALSYLGHPPPASLARAEPQTLLSWAIESWELQSVPKLATLPQQPL